MAKKKSQLTMSEQVGYLLNEMREVSSLHRYMQVIGKNPTIEDAISYGYALAQLQIKPKEVVGVVFKVKFMMTDEQFATVILGG